jgi:hypothetical protein
MFTVPPSPPTLARYRGSLRWMEGAPSTDELVVIAALLVGVAVLMLIAWRQVAGYARRTWDGFTGPSAWRLV